MARPRLRTNYRSIVNSPQRKANITMVSENNISSEVGKRWPCGTRASVAER